MYENAGVYAGTRGLRRAIISVDRLLRVRAPLHTMIRRIILNSRYELVRILLFGIRVSNLPLDIYVLWFLRSVLSVTSRDYFVPFIVQQLVEFRSSSICMCIQPRSLGGPSFLQYLMAWMLLSDKLSFHRSAPRTTHSTLLPLSVKFRLSWEG